MSNQNFQEEILETSGANDQEVSSQQPAVINLMNHLDGPKSVPNDQRLPSALSSVSTNPVWLPSPSFLK